MQQDPANTCVCLDLGTAMSKATVYLGAHDNDVAPLPIGLAAQAEHPLLTPSAMYVDDGRIFFGPAALKRAASGVEARRNPIVSFKMVLSAREIEPTLAMKLSRSVDPESVLCHRDGLVLYLAYLDQLIRAAVAADPGVPASAADAPRRLTSPNWQSFDEAGRIVSLLVDEAAAVSRDLGATLRAPEGVSLVQVQKVLAAARAQPKRGAFGGVVFESTSAAWSYASFARARDPLVLVIDMGAGTTDIAAFVRDAAVAPAKLAEIEESNQCCSLAGDELDNILIELMVRAGGRRALAAEDRLWRGVKLQARALKHDLFERGEAVFRDQKNKRIRLKRSAFERDPAFRAYRAALTLTLAESFAPLTARAKGCGANAITVMLAGGGSNLPFLPNVVRDAAKRAKVKLKLKIERFGANWSLPHRRHPFDGVFPQLAIAMGGALAPVATIAPRQLAVSDA